MKVLGIIPARFDSTRLPGKPLAMINGKPMIQLVYEQVLNSGAVDEVAIATDDERIVSAAKNFGAKVFLTNKNHTSGTRRCAEVAEHYKNEFDVVLNIQGDEPFIAAEQLDLVRQLLEKDFVKIVSLVKKISSKEELENPNVVKAVKSIDGKALYFSRTAIPFMRNAEADFRNQFSFFRHIGLYGFKTKTLLEIATLPSSPLELAESLEQLGWMENGHEIHLTETEIETLSIDTPEDLAKANALLT